MAESAITFLVRRLSTLLNGGQKFLEGIQQEIVYIMDEFEKMRDFSRVADAKDEKEDVELQVWIKQVQDLTHDVQDILEKHVVMLCTNVQEKGSWPWNHSSMSEKLFEAQNDYLLMMLKGVRARIIVISQGHVTFLQKYGVITSDTWCNNHEEVVLDDDADLVGIENYKSELVDWLISDDPEWKLHCVVGKRGVGKTTLVHTIYDDPAVSKNFDHTIWFDIPRFINLKELVMSFIDLQNDNTHRAIEDMDDNMLAESVQRCFESSRYLVVLDDVPDIGTWRTLKCVFPSKTRGCRVIIISRFAKICHDICVETGGDSRVCNLNPLSEDESWILFCRKAFSGSPLHPPPSLMQISKDIIEKCNGLPMTILVIAGALATKGNKIEAWELFHGRLVDKLQGNYSETEHMKRLLSICYQDLPFYLKSCFTYLSILPKNHVIEKMRLIQQWASEGLVLEREGKAIAQVAESYLNELANRKLIQVAKKYPDGRLESFTIHNLWYEIILSKSGEETIKPQEVRHLVITDKLVIYIQDIDQFKHLQSLTTLGYSITNSILLKLLSGSFKLLKVLDIPGAPLVNIPEEFFELVHLKFMNLRNTKIKVIPQSIRKLESLEFLDLRKTLVDKLPDEILRLQHLRHVFVYRWGSAGFSHGFKAPKKIGTMVSLEMVNLINATTSIVIELGKLTRLRKLNIAKLRKKHGKDLCSSLERLTNLEQLYISSCEVNDIIDLHYPLSSTHSSLRILVFEGRLERFPQWVMSLHALAVVHLKWSKLVDSTLQETLQDSPNLVTLVLDRAYEGEELRFGAGGFKKLKDLRIHHFTKLRQIKVEEGAMTSLEELQLRDCRLMEELPSGIEHLSSLKYLSLEQMPVKLLMTVKSWKIAHIPGVHIED